MVTRGRVIIGLMLVFLMLAACQTTEPQSPTEGEQPTDQQGEATQPPVEPTEPAEEEEVAAESEENICETDSLVVAAYGGTWEQAMTEAVVQPFQETYGVEVIQVFPGNSAEMLARLRAEQDSPTIDLALIGGGLESVAAREGLFEELDFSNIPNYDDIYDIAKSPVEGYGPSVAFSGVKLAYNTDHIDPAPTSWEVLWDPAYSGHIGFPNLDNNAGLMMLYLMAVENGGGIDNIDPGFEKLAQLTENDAHFTSSSPEMQDLFVQEVYWAAPMFDGRAAALIRDGFPIAMVCPEEGCFVTHTYANVVSGSPNKRCAEAFINEYLSPEAQVTFAQIAGYGPVNQTAELDEETAGLVIYGSDEIERLISLPWDDINEHRDEWVERWNREVLAQ